jgi:DNA polymerase III epsilon subunit family exonuclease
MKSCLLMSGARARVRNISDELLSKLQAGGRLSLAEIAENYFFTRLNQVSRKTILLYLENEPGLEVSGEIVRLKKKDPFDPVQPLSRKDFAFLDTETTFAGGRAIEIGIVCSRGGEETGRYSSLLNPGVPVDKGALELTGIRREEIAAARSFEEVWTEAENFLKGKVIVAHNLPFDRGVILNELQRAQIKFSCDLPALCTLKLARVLLKNEDHSLDALAVRFGLNAEIRHRALPDAVLAFKLFFKLIKYAEENLAIEIKTMGDLEELEAIYPVSTFR